MPIDSLHASRRTPIFDRQTELINIKREVHILQDDLAYCMLPSYRSELGKLAHRPTVDRSLTAKGGSSVARWCF